MKYRNCLLWLFALLFSLSCYAANSGIAYTDPMKSIVVKATEPTITITIASNPTTGFSWALKSYDANIIVPVARKFFPPANKKLIGAPGYEQWTFRVKPQAFVVPQITSITLVYSRPWDEQGAQVTNFKVVTSNAH